MSRFLAPVKWIALLAVGAITAELIARIEDAITWGAPVIGPYSEALLTMRDTFGIRGRPGFQYRKWRMNNLGFRGADLTGERAHGRARVIVLGASETFGLYEDPGKEYPVQLQRQLDSIAPNQFEVINGALPGMGLASMVPYFQHQVAPLAPDLVVLYPSPSFYLSVTPPPSDIRPAPPEPPARPAHETVFGMLSARTIARARDVAKALIPGGLVMWYRERQLAKTRAQQDAAWVWETVPPDRMALMGQQLNRILGTIRGAGVEVAVATHTNRFVGPAGKPIAGNRRHLVSLMSVEYPRASEQVMMSVDSAANGVIRSVAAANAVPVIEVEGKIPPTGEFFADYAHFTNEGARRMAVILADRIVALVPPGSRGGSASGHPASHP